MLHILNYVGEKEGEVMSTEKTILAKTVIGKGYKTSKQTEKIITKHKPDGVLGCWIINHTFTGERKDDYTEIAGSYEIHVWYSYEEGQHTAVMFQTVSYLEKVKVRIWNELERRPNCVSIVELINDPICINVDIIEEESQIEIEVEKSFLVKDVVELYLNIDTFPEQLAEFDEIDSALDEIDEVDPALDEIDELDSLLFDEEE